jgi:hypothetical protein
MQRQLNGTIFLYCPIREISVERRGARVKRFFVFEVVAAELENLTEARQSGTPGDFCIWVKKGCMELRHGDGDSGPERRRNRHMVK